jgi:hypothetical protein
MQMSAMKQHRTFERLTVTKLVMVIRSNPWPSPPIGPRIASSKLFL